MGPGMGLPLHWLAAAGLRPPPPPQHFLHPLHRAGFPQQLPPVATTATAVNNNNNNHHQVPMLYNCSFLSSSLTPPLNKLGCLSFSAILGLV
jgi:hypothetical protein